jgi:integrase
MGAVAIKEVENVTYLNIVQNKPKREARKKRGQKSEVFPYEPIELRRMLDYFASKGRWVHYLMLTLGVNTARRCGDLLTLTWDNLFFPNGEIRDEMKSFVEDKTDKIASPHINSAVKEAIKLYLSKTGVDPSENGYSNLVFIQTSGSYRGRPLTEDGHLKALKQAAKEVGITKNIGTHSARKTFGAINRRLHPNDYDSMELLRSIFNHSDVATTSRYIGLTQEKIDRYYDDMGEFYNAYVIGGKEIEFEDSVPLVTLDINDLRSLLNKAYIAGSENGNDMNVALPTLSQLMADVEKLKK